MMELELELEPRVRPLPYKIKAMSRESPAQKAAHVLDSDLRNHWSTGTNTKEWILLELDEPCLLSHIRIYNKSVLEWEITVGLRYKPEAFVKVRPRCEAPRRDVLYPMNYTPCRYVRISCLRGNPIAIFFMQLIGVSVTGLEPEFQPVVNYLLPHIISHKQDAHDMHLQLLQDMANRLLFLLPQLETDLASFTDAADSNICFLAMLSGPFYPIVRIVNEREPAKALLNSPDSDAFRNNQSSTLTVSSNFEAQPRRSRSPSPFVPPASSSIAFRPDAVIILLRKAYKDSHLGIVCRRASRALQKLVEPIKSVEESIPTSDFALSSISDELAKSEALGHMPLADYSSLFGEEFRVPDDHWDAAYSNVLDIAAVEEGILHVLYACASQPLLCCKLADSNSDFWSILPLVQALLPALRPHSSSPDQIDDSFWQWKQPFVQHALSQIVTMSSSSVYRPLLHACAGYLSSFLSSHAKAACVLIDLCSGPFSPWISPVVAKVDLTIELLEDLLGIIQGARQSRQTIARARAALKYIILALSGHMDDILSAYKEVKHKLLFLLEMLEPFLDPAIAAIKSTIAFGDVSTIFLEKQERTCAIALNVIRTAVRRPAVLPSLESEWRRGSVAPSVLLSILGPHMPLPPDIDLCKCPVSKVVDRESFIVSHGASSKSNVPDESDGKIDASEATVNAFEDVNLLFAPPELKKTVLTSLANCFIGSCPDKNNPENCQHSTEGRHLATNTSTNQFLLDNDFSAEYFNLQADYLQLVNHQDCEFRASEFQHLALDLCSQNDITPEGHDAAIDSLLLAAECYVNPFFMMSFRPTSKLINQMNTIKSKINQITDIMELDKNFQKNNINLEAIAHLERKRDETVLQILLQAAKLDRDYQKSTSKGEPYPYCPEDSEEGIDIHLSDMQSADAVTLVRKNQALLCHFVMQQLQREQHSSHEILLQSLLFLLYSATALFCPPENVIDIILQSAENLNGQLTSLHYQLKEGNNQYDPEKLHGVQRHWVILQRLIIASSGNDDGTDFISHTKNGFQYRNLIPPSSWMQKISKFSKCPYPLPRFLGWMAVSRYAKQYLKERLFIASDLSQLTSLLSIFADELALIDSIIDHKVEASNSEHLDIKHCLLVNKEFGHSEQSEGQESYPVLYPDLHKYFPNMKKQFGNFGEIILEAVGLHLKCLPCSAVPDVLCWFSDLCLCPYPETVQGHPSLNAANLMKGYAATNAKLIILYILESIVCEHMEAMLPEMPTMAQILISLCKSSYCDVAFLDSILRLLRPLISYFLRVGGDENQLSDVYSQLDFEINFEELFDSIRCRKEYQDSSGEKYFQGSLMIFILGTLFPDLSFRRMSEVLQSLLLWVDFTTSEPTSSLYNYLCAFQKVIDSCALLLLQNLEYLGMNIPVEQHQLSEAASTTSLDGSSNIPRVFTASADQSSLIWPTREFKSSSTGVGPSVQQIHCLSPDEVKEFSEGLELLISRLFPAIEVSWKLHYQLAMKLTFISAKCILFSRCLNSIRQAGTTGDGDGGSTCTSDSSDILSKHWRNALEGLTAAILAVQQNQCWQVASSMLDYLLSLPQNITLDCVVSTICSVIMNFCRHAPMISWRLQTGKWLSSLFMRGLGSIDGDEASLADLFSNLLGHSEPEQRSIAIQLLGRIVGLDAYDGVAKLPYAVRQNLVGSDSVISVRESIISILVSSTWDRVAALAFSDPSLLLRTHAMTLLFGYLPFAEQTQLQSFLVASSTLLRGMGKLYHSIEEGHSIRLSLCLLASACLYSPAEDIALIPESVWRNLESMGMSKSGVLDDMEKNMCLILCKLRTESDGARVALKEALSPNLAAKNSDPNFKSTRESILQVLSSLSSVRSYFDFFSKKFDKESQELEEAEIEIDLLQKEKAFQEVSTSSQEETVTSQHISYHEKDNSRLQQIKDDIRSIEKSKLREEIIVRRQKKLFMRRARQKYLEDAAAREMDLLQELDREKASELEREIERQRQLELERTKTRELQFKLDMERERQTQKELQHELEQVESGIRSSQRDYSSNPNSRTRERYRERENGRPGHEGGLRSSSRGHEGGPGQAASSGTTLTSPVPTVVLAGSRSFSGQLPTILQSRDRMDDRGTGYDDNFEGSRDSGDTSSTGDPELASAFDGLPGGYGLAPRHGLRGGKSRQVLERRERDGRREGKWERKHS